MKKTLLLFIGLSFLISCTNDDSPSEVDSDQNPVDFFPQNYIGTSGQLKKMKWTMGDGTPNSNWYFSYNGNKLDKKTSYNPINTIVYYDFQYQYTNDLISEVYISNVLSEELNYDNQNRLIERVGIDYKDEYEYLTNGIRWIRSTLDSNNNYVLNGDNLLIVDSNNQILEIKNYSNNTSVGIYEYDDKIAPMRNILGLNKLLSNFNQDDSIFNNITKQIDPLSGSNLLTINYEYLNQKPIKATYSNSSGIYLTIDLEYY
tara:strand:+ start:26 stop:802 length:777 start_codon:yes stop_codon:yes gene_type:complete